MNPMPHHAPSPTTAPARAALLDVLSVAALSTEPDQGPSPRRDLVRAVADVEEVVHVITGELVADAPGELAPAAIEAALDAILTDKALLPATRRREPKQGESREQAEARGRELDELRAAAWSASTLSTYAGGLRAWRTWCHEQQVPALPFEPGLVSDHLIDYAFERESDGGIARDEQGRLRSRVSASSVAIRLASLNKAATFLGLPKPGENPGVAEVVRGIRRAIGVAPRNRKAALDMAGIRACVRVAGGASLPQLRDRALVLLRARTGATTGQLASLSWADVEVGAKEVTVHLPPRNGGGRVRRVVVGTHRDRVLCLHATLTSLRDLVIARGLPFASVAIKPDGSALTRQAPFTTMEKLFAEHGGFRAVPGLGDQVLRRALLTPGAASTVSASRDRALLLVGWYTASRRANLSALTWRDVIDHGSEGWEVIHRRSKTDQDGVGRRLWLPASTDSADELCPAQALRAWQDTLSMAIGRQLRPEDPVFVPVSASGVPALGRDGRLRRLPGDAINDAVQRLTVAAGLAPASGRNPYGAHSLRSGFVTEALRDDKLTIPEVADITGHASLNVLFTYRREVNLATTSPTRKLMRSLST